VPDPSARPGQQKHTLSLGHGSLCFRSIAEATASTVAKHADIFI
jgi:hypothetical protein